MMLVVLLCEARHLLLKKTRECMNRSEHLIGSLRFQLTGEEHSLV